MRILHVVGTLDRGGIENLIKNISNYTSDITFDFIVHKANGAYQSYFESLGGKVYVFEKNTFMRPIKYFKFLKSVVKVNNYEIVHSHMNHRSGYILFLFKLIGVQIRIAHCHIGALEGNFFKRFLKVLSGKLIKPGATHLFTCSVKAAHWMFGKRECEKKGLTFIPNGVLTNRFEYDNEIRNELRTKHKIDDKFVVGHVGRFNTQKNHKFLLEIFTRINQKHVLVLVGEGSLLQECKEYVKDHDLGDTILFTGSIDNVNQYYSMFDVFVLPSLYEGLPLTAIEAQINGLPVLLSDTITSEVDLGFGNVHFMRNDLGLWIDKLSLDFKRSNNTRNQILDCGFDIEVISSNLECFYKDVIK